MQKDKFIPLLSCVIFSILFFYLYHHVSLDDAAIYERLIHNVIHFGVWSYNLDQLSNPLTSFFYPIVLIPLCWMLRSVPIHSIAAVLDTVLICTASLLVSLYFLRKEGTPNRSILFFIAAGMPIILPIGMLIGMETSILLLFLSIYLFFFDHQKIRSTVVAFLPLVRPEAIVFLPLEIMYIILLDRGSKSSLSSRLLQSLIIVLPTMFMVAFNLAIFSLPLPRSVLNKMSQGVQAKEFGLYKHFIRSLFFETWSTPWTAYLAILAILGALRTLLSRQRGLASLMVGLLLWQAALIFRGAPAYYWYSAPLMFLSFLLGLNGLQLLTTLLESRRTILGHYLANSYTFLTLIGLLIWRLPTAQQQPESRQREQQLVAEVVQRNNTAPFAKVAVTEAGHIGNLLPADKYSIVDLCGLTSVNKGYFQVGFNDQLFCELQPDFLLINYLPDMLNEFTFTSSESAHGNFRLAVTKANDLSEGVWPQNAGILFDRRFHETYHFVEDVKTANYPGGIAIFKRSHEIHCPERADISSVTSTQDFKEEFIAAKAVDRDFRSGWNAGAMAPQQLVFHLSKATVINTINLYVHQTPSGNATHLLTLYDAEGREIENFEFTESLRDKDILHLSFAALSVKRVTLTTTSSTSWIAWREVEFLNIGHQ